jgi:hypothetical protein
MELARLRRVTPLPEGSRAMTISLVHLQPLVALIAGILILLVPRLLNFIVAIYLIIVGITGLWPGLLH